MGHDLTFNILQALLGALKRSVWDMIKLKGLPFTPSRLH